MKKLAVYSSIALAVVIGVFAVKHFTAKADVFGSSLVGWYTFDSNRTVNNIADSSASGNTGNLVGAATTTAVGISGQGMAFNGTTQGVDLGASASLSIGAGSFTYSIWVYRATAINSFVIGSRSASGVTAGYDLLTGIASVPGTWACRIADGVTGVEDDSVFNLTDWQLLSCTVDRGTNLLSQYLNGRLMATTSIATLGSIANTLNPSLAKRGSTFWAGTLDEARFYSRALSNAEVMSLYYAGKGQHQR